MAGLTDLTLDVWEMLYGQPQVTRPAEDTLATEVTNLADVEWRFTTSGMWKRGDYAEKWGNDGTAYEVVRMTEDHPSGASDVTVRRSQRRTTGPASTIAVGTVYLKNPPYTVTEVQRAINETIDNDLDAAPFRIWYRSKRSLTPVTAKHYYEMTAEDYYVEDAYQIDLGQAAVGGTWSYDEAGGAADDLWTCSAAHGRSVGDHVRFTTAGTNATGYAAGTDYWVAAAASTTTATFAATRGGTAIAGSTDGTGWVLAKQLPSIHPIDNNHWEVLTDAASNLADTSNTIFRLASWHNDNHPVYYTARTKPSSAAISSLPADVVDLVPYGAMARLLAQGSARDRYEPRRRQGEERPTQPFQDSEFFRSRFLEMRRSYRNRLILEKPPARRTFRGYLWRG